MKNSFLVVWNMVLTIVVTVMLLLHFREGNVAKTSSVQNVPVHISDSSSIKIAYINIDSLEERYELFAQKKKEMESKQQQAQSIFDRKMTEFQNDYQSAQQSASTMTQSQLAATSESLKKKQDELQQLQDQLQNDFQRQLTEFNKQLKDSLDSFLKDYNRENRFAYVLSQTEGGAVLYGEPALNITSDAVRGMNSRLKKK